MTQNIVVLFVLLVSFYSYVYMEILVQFILCALLIYTDWRDLRLCKKKRKFGYDSRLVPMIVTPGCWDPGLQLLCSITLTFKLPQV